MCSKIFAETPFFASRSEPRSLPDLSTTPVFISSPTASMMPEPQMPMGLVSPITLISTPLSSIKTLSIAPAAARMPYFIELPSKAGPAAVEQAVILPLAERTISPFVPISMNKWPLSLCIKSVVMIPAVMSEPTCPAMLGTTMTFASSAPLSPVSLQSVTTSPVNAGANGATAREAGSMFRNRWLIVVLPTTAYFFT